MFMIFTHQSVFPGEISKYADVYIEEGGQGGHRILLRDVDSKQYDAQHLESGYLCDAIGSFSEKGVGVKGRACHFCICGSHTVLSVVNACQLPCIMWRGRVRVKLPAFVPDFLFHVHP